MNKNVQDLKNGKRSNKEGTSQGNNGNGKSRCDGLRENGPQREWSFQEVWLCLCGIFVSIFLLEERCQYIVTECSH